MNSNFKKIDFANDFHKAASVIQNCFRGYISQKNITNVFKSFDAIASNIDKIMNSYAPNLGYHLDELGRFWLLKRTI